MVCLLSGVMLSNKLADSELLALAVKRLICILFYDSFILNSSSGVMRSDQLIKAAYIEYFSFLG